VTFISYAQNYEDVMLRRAFQDIKKGFYIDVGANDPVIDSVTKAFYDAGWHGINIEPVTEWFNKLQEARPNDTNLKLACGTKKGQNTIYDVVGTGLSTMDKLIADKHANELDFEIKKEKIKVDSLTNICKQHANQDIHFLKIDVEGFEMQVLKGLDLKKIRPWIIVIESTLPNSQIEDYGKWESILINGQYHFAYFDGLNRYYIADEHEILDCKFDSSPNFFDNFIRVEQLNSELRAQQAQAQLETQVQKIDELQVSLTERTVQQQVLDANLKEIKAQREQLETQVQNIQDEAVQRDEKLREKETKQQELLLSLLEKETRLQEAAAKLTERKQKIDELQVSLTERTVQQQVLDANLKEIKAQREQLETQVQSIQDEAVQRKEKLREKDESNNWLNNEWNAAKQKVDELHQSNHHWWSMADQQSKELEVRQAKIDELNHSSHHWWLEAERLTKELQTVHNSKSWRITWPLRKLMQFFKWLLRLPIRLVLWLVRLPKRTVRWLLVKIMDSVIKHPALKVRTMNWLHNYPNLKEKLRRLAQARSLIASQQNNLPTQGQSEPTVSGNQDTAVASDLLPLTPNARRIYGELKAAMAQSQKESR